MASYFREVVLGEHNIVTNPDCGFPKCDCSVQGACAAPKITRKITSPDQITVHEDFNYGQTPLKNDIALIRLNEPVPIFKDNPAESIASPICLPWLENDTGRLDFSLTGNTSLNLRVALLKKKSRIITSTYGNT